MESPKSLFEGKTLVNCTEHDIVLVDEIGRETHRIAPSGQNLRYQIYWGQAAAEDAVPISWARGAMVDALPPEIPDTLYIVSSYYGQYAALLGRKDFVVPGQLVTSPDHPKRILGCRSLNWCLDLRAAVFELPPGQ